VSAEINEKFVKKLTFDKSLSLLEEQYFIQ